MAIAATAGRRANIWQILLAPFRRAVPAKAVRELPGTDFSLQSNGETYLDRAGECKALEERIEENSASVIGLSGVRGAGKSSLAKYILGRCEAKGYFHLLIPSPTAYEPRDFLIAVFQRVSEECAQRLNERVWGSERPLATGASKARNVGFQIWATCIAIFLLVVVVSGGNWYFTLSETRAADRSVAMSEVQALITYYNGQQDEITQKVAVLPGEIPTPAAAAAPAPVAAAAPLAGDQPVRPVWSPREVADFDNRVAKYLVQHVVSRLSHEELRIHLQANTRRMPLSDSDDLALETEDVIGRIDTNYPRFEPIDSLNNQEIPEDSLIADALRYSLIQVSSRYQVTSREPYVVPIFPDSGGSRVFAGYADFSKEHLSTVRIPINVTTRIERQAYATLKNVVAARLSRLDNRLTALKTPAVILSGTLITLGLAAVVFLLAAIVTLLALRVRRLVGRYRRISRNKRDVGVIDRCGEFSRKLQYETTLSTGSEIGVITKLFSGKVSSGRQLADRPLTLPGLTSLCTEFVDDIAESFQYKIVICIDELDKIADTAQLLELLRGVKGVLGTRHTHFIMTVSEDATDLFRERRGGERTMMESAFEEIVYLDRISFPIARRIAETAPDAYVGAGKPAASLAALYWVFGAGVPREVKRAIQKSASSGTDPIGVWRNLYLEMVENVAVPRKFKTYDAQVMECEFLKRLDSIRTAVMRSQGSKPDFGAFRASAEETLRLYLTPAGVSEDATPVSFAAPAVELLIGASCFGIATGDIAVPYDGGIVLGMLVEAYKTLPQNPYYALHLYSEAMRRSGAAV